MPSPAQRVRKRRTVNEINMVPFIDVMLVLLIIFMVTAPMLTPGAINVPSAGQSTRPPVRQVARVLLDRDGSIALHPPEGTPQALPLAELGQATRQWQDGQTGESAVVILADRSLPYDKVVQVLSALHGAGVRRVALGVTSAPR